MAAVSMTGVIDVHVHSNPDLHLQAYDDIELMEAGIRTGARAIVIKTHQGTTMIGPISATVTTRSPTAGTTISPGSAASP